MKAVSEILEKTLRRLPQSKKIMGQMIIDAWPRAVGETISQKTAAVSFENGVLHVKVQDSVWAQHLSLQKLTIIRKLNSMVHTRMLKDLRFQVGSWRQHIGEGRLLSGIDEAGGWWDINLHEADLLAVEQALQEAVLEPELEARVRAFLLNQKKRQAWLLLQGSTPCRCCSLPVEKGAGGPDGICYFCQHDFTQRYKAFSTLTQAGKL